MKKSLIVIDTNAVVSLITNDVPGRSAKIFELLAKEDCIVPMEVIAETAFVLEGRFGQSRQEIAGKLKEFISLKENLVVDENIARFACNVFAATKLDFVDCLLDAYAKVNGNRVFTFDNDLNKQLEHLAYNG